MQINKVLILFLDGLSIKRIKQSVFRVIIAYFELKLLFFDDPPMILIFNLAKSFLGMKDTRTHQNFYLFRPQFELI